jgi:Reverse transcriptase (RNA-dependent DNA polymerase)
VRGRCIIDNTILIWEIIHSFTSAGYEAASFALKADINKVFDTIEWSFIKRALEFMGLPDGLIQLIMSCIGERRITVLVNGKGEGFFKPTWGLRQGCSLPYLFIIAMEVLTQGLNQAREDRRLHGIQVALEAPTITHTIYADDLVLFGATKQKEIRQLLQILADFRLGSGLEVNLAKSTIWFSRKCDNRCRQEVLTAFHAKLAQPAEKYLWIYITTSRKGPDPTHQLLVDNT